MNKQKVSKFSALALALLIAAGCSSKGGDSSGNASGTASADTGMDPNSGYGFSNSTFDAGIDSGSNVSMGSEIDALRAITTFYFEYDSSDLRPEAMRALDVHAGDLKASGQRIVLEGHADERGTREYNMALGERRAGAVQRYLVLQGVSPAQLELVSYGEERPIAVGNSEESWAQNRRVELRK